MPTYMPTAQQYETLYRVNIDTTIEEDVIREIHMIVNDNGVSYTYETTKWGVFTDINSDNSLIYSDYISASNKAVAMIEQMKLKQEQEKQDKYEKAKLIIEEFETIPEEESEEPVEEEEEQPEEQPEGEPEGEPEEETP